jgi:crotonobetainyl-CoA:carnitine CoA-transferase CaiB-like acyl-CoA transferase
MDGGSLLAGPLAGIKVIDLSRVLAGPWASQLLADYGADVIKVERPASGDDTRSWGPPWLKDSNGCDTAESAYFQSANRNKRSMTVDLAQPRGQQIVKALAADADVFIENFRVGTLKRFGLDSDTLRSVNPKLVYCTISAWGQDGTRSSEPGYDAMMQASGGLMSITGAPDGDGGGPQKVGVAIADIMAGMYATTAILAALHARKHSGSGQSIDVPLYDTQVAWLANQAMNYLVTGKVPQRLGTAHPNIVPYQAFETRDGHLMLAVGNDRQFRSCAACLGCAELAELPEYATNAARVANRDRLIAVLAEQFRHRETAYWIDALRDAQVPCGPINDLADVFSGPYAAERQLVLALPHPVAGSAPGVANPVRFSDTPVDYRLAPPTLGQHTSAILRDTLGYSDSEIDELRQSGVT